MIMIPKRDGTFVFAGDREAQLQRSQKFARAALVAGQPARAWAWAKQAMISGAPTPELLVRAALAKGDPQAVEQHVSNRAMPTALRAELRRALGRPPEAVPSDSLEDIQAYVEHAHTDLERAHAHLVLGLHLNAHGDQTQAHHHLEEAHRLERKAAQAAPSILRQMKDQL